MGTPKMPDTPTPAIRPERKLEVDVEDIELGGSETTEKPLGKKALRRPSVGSTTPQVKTGLQI